MTITRALILDLYRWTTANRCAAADYYAHPTVFNGRDTCAMCIQPVGTTPDCERCRSVRSMRKSRANRRAA